MRIYVVAGLLVMALVVAVISAVNADCPTPASSMADVLRMKGGPSS